MDEIVGQDAKVDTETKELSDGQEQVSEERTPWHGSVIMPGWHVTGAKIYAGAYMFL